jgi:mono/diheme cytochrome c family protein
MISRRIALFTAALAGAACQNPRPAPEEAKPAARAADTALPRAAAETQAPTSHAELVKRGERLVTLGGCADCHTPKAFDPKLKMPVPQSERAFSGHPENGPEPQVKPGAGDQAVIGASFTSFAAPFGVVYAANLTPDPDTGIGKWSEAEFVKTLRTGHEKGSGRPLLPPMPWQNLATQPDEDLRAIYAYFMSLRPIKNQVPAPHVPPPVIAAIGASYPAPEAVN